MDETEKMVHQDWDDNRWPYEACHCFGKPGLFRKSRPLQDSCRMFIAIRQQEKTDRNKRLRREKPELEEARATPGT